MLRSSTGIRLMEITFFTDLINALGKVATGLKAFVNLPMAERETIRLTLDETYRLIDTTLDIVIIRLGDIQIQPSDDNFLREVARLDNDNEWMQAEREFRLCHRLRIALRETETLAGRLAGAMSAKGWNRCYGRYTPFSLPKAKLRYSLDRSFNNSLTMFATWIRALGQFNPIGTCGPPFADRSSPNGKS